MTDFSESLQSILDRQNLTIYGAAQLIGAETDEPIKTIHERLRQWLRRPPKSWHSIEVALNALGYKITIEKNNDQPGAKKYE